VNPRRPRPAPGDSRGLVQEPGSNGAFVVGGLKEFGEPARKASIVDLCRAESRGRAIGVYYTIRNLLVVPAGIIGGMLWQRSPALVLETAGAVSAMGLIVFMMNRADRGRWQIRPTSQDAVSRAEPVL